MPKIYFIYLTLIFSGVLYAGADINVIQSDQSKLLIDVTFDVFSRDDLKPISILVGLPNNTYPDIEVEYGESLQHNTVYSDSLPNGVRWIQKQKLRQHFVATLQVSPYVDQNTYYKKITIIISFNRSISSSATNFIPSEDSFFKNRVVNWNVARQWTFPVVKKLVSLNNLPSGEWIKFAVFQDDIHALDGNTILNILPSNLSFDPRSLMLFTGGNLGRAMDQSIGIDHL